MEKEKEKIDKIRLVNPIEHDGIAYTRGVYSVGTGPNDISPALAETLLAIHSADCTSYEPANPKANTPEKPKGVCRNHPAVPFVPEDTPMGTATATKPGFSGAGVAAPPPPPTSGPGSATPTTDAARQASLKREADVKAANEQAAADAKKKA
jgi:hypothetical protein